MRNDSVVVVVDRLPLMRAGMVAALAPRVVREARTVPEGVALVRRDRAGALVLGDAIVSEVIQAVTELRDSNAAVVVLLSRASRDEIIHLLGAGVAGLVLRSATSGELDAALGSVLAGQRSVGSAFVPLLVGFSQPDPLAVAGINLAGEGGDAAGLAMGSALTNKEREVLTRLAEGATNQQIAAALYVTPATVKTHLAHIYAKLEVTDRHEAVSRGLSLGILH